MNAGGSQFPRQPVHRKNVRPEAFRSRNGWCEDHRALGGHAIHRHEARALVQSSDEAQTGVLCKHRADFGRGEPRQRTEPSVRKARLH